jgi:hypothetical protein
MSDYFRVIDKSQETSIRAHLAKERNKRAAMVAENLANGVGLPINLFKKKKREFREKNNVLLEQNMMYLSDELEETDTLSEKQKQFMNEKVLGY